MLKGWRFFPRSLHQLVIVAFLLVLLPLLILVLNTYRSLETLSMQAAQMNATTQSDARRSEEMAGLVRDMQRSYLQYCVLKDNALKAAYQKQYRKYSELLNDYTLKLSRSLPRTERLVLPQAFHHLDVIKCSENSADKSVLPVMEAFVQENVQMTQKIQTLIARRGSQLQQEITQRGRELQRLSLLLFLASAVLIVLFSSLIIRPVKYVENMILRLGKGEPLTEAKPIQGPTEIAQLARRILWLSQRLRELESQRHDVLRNISHDLKTPLVSIREGVALLRDNIVGPLNSDQQEIAQIIDNSSQHLHGMIEQLLDYNRMLLEQVDCRPVELTPLIQSVIAAHDFPARLKQLTTELQLDVTVCEADPVLLKRAIDNLYSNAVHYGAQSGTIWCRSRRQGDKIQIDIANTGEPLSGEERQKIFAPFYQGSHQRQGTVKGSGLGLYIAYNSVKRMHGELTLADSDEQVVCFRIELPSQGMENTDES